MCNPDKLAGSIAFIRSNGITALKIGKELAGYIDVLEDLSYLHEDIADYTKKLLDNNKAKILGSGNNLVAV